MEHVRAHVTADHDAWSAGQNLSTGDATLVGSTGLPMLTNVAGLATNTTPEPTTFGLLGVLATAGAAVRSRRRGCQDRRR